MILYVIAVSTQLDGNLVKKKLLFDFQSRIHILDFSKCPCDLENIRSGSQII